MGKSGAALRAKKGQSVSYTFTRDQLEAHDRKVREEFRDEYRRLAKKTMEGYKQEADERVRKYFDELSAEFNSGNSMNDLSAILSYLVSVSCRVLVEHFGWAPVPKSGAFRNRRIARFANLIVDEIEKISEDGRTDLRDYCDEVYEKYGIRFVSEDEPGGVAGSA